MMLKIIRSISIALLGLLAACGGKKAVIEPAPLPENEQVISWQTNWKIGTGKGDDELYLNLQPGMLDNSSRSVMYTADSRGRVMAIDLQSGEAIWTQKMPKTDVVSGVGGGEKNVVMGTKEGEIVALDAQTGEQQWRTLVSSEALATPAVENGFVAVLTGDSHVYGLDESSGKILWDVRHTAPLLKLRGGASPIIHKNLVFVGFANGQISIFDRTTGHVRWQETIAIPQGRSEVERMVDINGRMVVHDNILYVVTYQGKIMAFNFAENTVRWTKDMSSYVGVAGADNTLVVSDEDGNVWGMNSKTGAVLWEQTLLRYRELTTPAIVNNLVLVGDDDGNLHALSLADGEWLGYTKIDGSGIRAKPIIVGNTAYVYARDGSLVSVTPGL